MSLKVLRVFRRPKNVAPEVLRGDGHPAVQMPRRPEDRPQHSPEHRERQQQPSSGLRFLRPRKIPSLPPSSKVGDRSPGDDEQKFGGHRPRAQSFSQNGG